MDINKEPNIFDIVMAFIITLILGHIFGINNLIGLMIVCAIASTFVVLTKIYMNEHGVEL